MTVPQGSQILNAHVQFTADEVDSVGTNVLIRGEAAGDAAAFTTDVFNVTTRPTTVSSANWNPEAWAAISDAGAAQQTPNVAPLIQEIVDRADWAAANALVLVFATSTGERASESFNSAPSEAPLLHIDYQPPDDGRP